METHRQSLGASTTNLPVAPKLAYRFAVVRGFICLLIWRALIELILYTGLGIRLYRVPVVNLATTFAYFPFVEILFCFLYRFYRFSRDFWALCSDTNILLSR